MKQMVYYVIDFQTYKIIVFKLIIRQ